MAKTIRINLNNASTIDNAIKELREYQTQLKTKTQLFTERLADVGITMAEMQSRDVSGSFGTHKMGSLVTFTKTPVGNGKTIMIGVGQEFESIWTSNGELHSAVVKPLSMLEFGSGALALEPQHRFGVDGGQGTMATQGHENDKQWGANGRWTAITPTRPMDSAYNEMVLQIRTIAKQVWS